jgi:hypothetical protein
MRDTPSWREYLAVFAIALIFLYLSNFRSGTFIYSLSQVEGGVWIDEAVRTLHGEWIYRDFFEFLAPGIIYLNAAVLGLFGETTTVVGGLIVVLGAVAAVTVHAASGLVLPRGWRTASTAVFTILTYSSYSPGNHKWPTIILCLLGILAVAHDRSPLRCALAGIALAGATLCTQDFGAGAAVGIGAALWLLHRREGRAAPGTFVLAYLLTVGTTLAVFAVVAGPRTVWYDLVVFPLRQYPNANQFGVGLGGMRHFARTAILLGLGSSGLIYAGLGLRRRFWRTDPAPVVIMALTGMTLLLIGSWARPIEPTGFGVRAVPATIIGLLALREWIDRPASRAVHLLRLIAPGFLVLTLGVYAAARLVASQATRPMERRIHRAGAIWELGPWDDLAWLEEHTVAGEAVFLFPDKGGMFFLSRTRNATAFPWVSDMGFTSDRQIAAALDQTAAACPAVGIWDSGRLSSVVDVRPDRFSLRPLYRGLLRDYEVAEHLPNGSLALRRRPARTLQCRATNALERSTSVSPKKP